MVEMSLVVSQVESDLRNKKFNSALGKLTTISLTHSHDLVYLNLLAQVLRGLRDDRALIKTLSEMSALAHDASLEIELMSLLYKNGYLNEALDVGLHLQTISLSPQQNKELLYLLTHIYIEENDFEGAREVIGQLDSADQLSDFILWSQGLISLFESDNNQALAYFRQAVALNKNYDQAWVSLALLHHEMGDFELALANLEMALDCNQLNQAAVKLYSQWTEGLPLKTESALQKIRFYLLNYNFDEEISLCHIQKLCALGSWKMVGHEVEKLRNAHPHKVTYHDMKKKLGDQALV